ncbi:MFS transporter [Salinicoccus halitifaciens]|uniref:MFS family permease n=1 Tax=Salinicoccus halitifaciens TaxID=1073415 RepID=A0ABV2EB18_9STAP|nr:MFS transporter [Salinicoccus halitifaciens]MCD2138456.1 MFS transporter [Salinicoccus halitifaciens]
MTFTEKMPFREKQNFAVYLFSRMMLGIGDYVYLFAVSYFILYETGSSLYFSINLAISILVSVILLPFSGLLSDRGNKRRIVITGEVMFTLVLFGLFIYSYFVGISLPAIYTATFLMSLISPFIENALQASMTELFHKDRIQKIMGYVSAMLSASIIAGPVLGGILFGLFSFYQIILVYLMLFMISTIMDFLLKFNLYFDSKNYEEEAADGRTVSGFKKDITEGLNFIRKNDVLKRVLIMAAFINFVGATLSILPEKMMITELNFEPALVGYANACLGAGMIIGGLLLGSAKKMKNPLAIEKKGLIFLAVLTMLYPLPIYLGMSVVPNFIYVGLLGFMLAVSLQFINIPFGIYLQLIVPQKIKGRVLSTMALVASSLMPLGTIIYGVLYDLGGYWIINLTSGGSIAVITVLLLNKEILKKSGKSYGEAVNGADIPEEKRPERERAAEPLLPEAEAHI